VLRLVINTAKPGKLPGQVKFGPRSGSNQLLRIESRKALDHGYPAKLLVGSGKHRYQTGPF
jgi:hypothetical protein